MPVNKVFFLFFFVFLIIAIFEFFNQTKNKAYYIDVAVSFVTLTTTLMFSYYIDINRLVVELFVNRCFTTNIELPVFLQLIISVMVMDFLYYWMHRCEHYFGFLWASHYVHHSSPYFNSFVSIRPSLFQFLYFPLFMIPLFFLPFNLDVIINSIAFGKIYSLFTHYECSPHFVEKYCGWLFVTPKLHKIHHACNKKYVDKNFGGVFIIWDKLFRTYVNKADDIKLGVGNGNNYSFLTGVFGGFYYIKNKLAKKKSFMSKVKSIIFMKV